jgi:2-polyprenyl-6-methoxyphenol hydroxylase-like FAD-dependent oxidoreductase
MADTFGQRAVVIGAGMAGLATAAALYEHFDEVVILERDAVLPPAREPRRGVPQGRHVHTLLAGGENALATLLPGFSQRLTEAGAAPLRHALDVRLERPGYDPFPYRDFGFKSHSVTRPTLEHLVRQMVSALPNVTMRAGCSVSRLEVDDRGERVNGVVYKDGEGRTSTLPADLILDATGRGEPSLALLEQLGLRPEASIIGVDFGYASALFEIPSRHRGGGEWKSVMTFPNSPASSRGALLVPVEGDRWLLSLAGRLGDYPPADEREFRTFTRELRTPTVHDAIAGAERLGPIERFRFQESRRWHMERLGTLPDGWLCVGDALCRFNPVYGQGMTVSALEAVALRDMLCARSAERSSLRGLAKPFFEACSQIIEGPWMMAAIPDFIFPRTRGTRPADLDFMIKFAMSLWHVAAQDPAVHKLLLEVSNMLKPRSAYLEDPTLISRVLAVSKDVPTAAPA